MIKYKRLLFGYIILIMFMGGCFSQKQSVSVENAWANPGIMGGNSAIFFQVSNPTETDDNLLEVRSTVASAVEIHQTSEVDGVMKMERQFSVPVLHGEKTIFKPGDLHVMLIGLDQELNVGDKFDITLIFEHGDAVSVNVMVREP